MALVPPVLILLALLAFLLTILAITNPPKCPLWVPVLLLALIALLERVPR